MELRIAPDYATMSEYAAQYLADALAAKPDANIIMPTGETPRGFYVALARLHQRGAFDVSRLRIFQLDEYVGLAPDNPRSFAGWLRRALLDPLGIDNTRVVRFRSDAADLDAACRAYDRALQVAGGADIVVLGLGRNGHLGFNEPPADASAPTRVVRLSEETISSNERYWDNQAVTPARAITCGMANILAARHKLLQVSGAHKRDILRRALTGSVTPATPATYLQKSDHVTVCADLAAWPWPQSIAADGTT